MNKANAANIICLQISQGILRDSPEAAMQEGYTNFTCNV